MKIKYITLDDDGLHVDFDRSDEGPRTVVYNQPGVNTFAEGPVAAATLEADALYYDEDTLPKVREAISRAVRESGSASGWTAIDDAVRGIISELQNAGIVFREVC